MTVVGVRMMHLAEGLCVGVCECATFGYGVYMAYACVVCVCSFLCQWSYTELQYLRLWPFLCGVFGLCVPMTCVCLVCVVCVWE